MKHYAHPIEKIEERLYTIVKAQNCKKAQKDRQMQKYLDDIMNKKGARRAFNSYGDPIVDGIFHAVTVCANSQRRLDPERAPFWGKIMAEYFNANAVEILPDLPFHNDALLYYYDHIADIDANDANAVDKLLFRSANNAIYTYKRNGDGARRTIDADITDIEKTRSANAIISVKISVDPVKNGAQQDFILDILSVLPKKQYIAMCHYYKNCALFGTLEDIYNFGYSDRYIKDIFKNFHAFEVTFYRAKKALKERFFNDDKILSVLATICD